MAHRTNWKECQSSVTTLFNFKWQQNIIGLDFCSLCKTIKQTVNHFENHMQISNKCNLFINLMKYCEAKGLEAFKYMPFTVLFQYDNSSYSEQMENFTSMYNNIKDYILNLNQNSNYNSTDTQFFNYNKMKKYGILFDIYGSGNERLGNKTLAVINPNHYDRKNFWIVKACDLNRGRCIKMADSLPRVQKLVKKFYEGISKEYTNEDEELLSMPYNIVTEDDKKKLIINKYRTNSVIVQKYIEKPLLYRGRKFDIRIWTMITHKSQVFVFKEGHLKTSSVPYDINLTNSYVHITNYSIQKYNDNFSKFEYGNEVYFQDFQNYIDECGKPINVRKDIFSKIKEIIEITCRSVFNKINPNNRKNCFEIFGYDFIMDIDYNVFLLEVNTNPGLEESSPLIKTLVPRMLDDALRLTIDDLYDTKYTFFEKETSKSDTYYSPFLVEGYTDSENLWEMVCDLIEKDNFKTLEKRKRR
jgi:hypothetical protein